MKLWFLTAKTHGGLLLLSDHFPLVRGYVTGTVIYWCCRIFFYFIFLTARFHCRQKIIHCWHRRPNFPVSSAQICPNIVVWLFKPRYSSVSGGDSGLKMSPHLKSKFPVPSSHQSILLVQHLSGCSGKVPLLHWMATMAAIATCHRQFARVHQKNRGGGEMGGMGSVARLTSCCCGNYALRMPCVSLTEETWLLRWRDKLPVSICIKRGERREKKMVLLIIYWGKCCPVALADGSDFKCWDT